MSSSSANGLGAQSRSSSGFSAAGEDAEARAARVAAARAMGASIAKQVEVDSGATRKSGSSASSAVVDEFRRYGENEAAKAAREMQSQMEIALTRGAAALQQAASKSFDKKGKAKLNEMAVMLKREESARQTQFTALLSRVQFSSREDDQMAAVREYASVCRGMIGRIMAELPHLPPAIAPIVSAYLSVMSQHETLATKALATEDPRRAEQEAAARNAARLAKAKCASEARASGLYAPTSPNRSKEGRL